MDGFNFNFLVAAPGFHAGHIVMEPILAPQHPDFIADDDIQPLEIDDHQDLVDLMHDHYVPHPSLSIPPPPAWYYKVLGENYDASGVDIINDANRYAITMQAILERKGFSAHPAMYADNPIWELNQVWKIPLSSPFIDAMIDAWIVAPDPVGPIPCCEDTGRCIRFCDRYQKLNKIEEEAVYKMAVTDMMPLECNNMMNIYRGKIEEGTGYNPMKTRTRPGYFGTPFYNPQKLSEQVLVNVKNVFNNFVGVQHKKLALVLQPHAFAGFYKFLQDFSPLTQQQWLDRGNLFFKGIEKGFHHFKKHYPLTRIHSADRLKTQYNVLQNFFNQVSVQREIYRDVPQIEFVFADFDTIDDAIMDFPIHRTNYLYQVMQTQPAGILFLQELLYELLGFLCLIHPYVNIRDEENPAGFQYITPLSMLNVPTENIEEHLREWSIYFNRIDTDDLGRIIEKMADDYDFNEFYYTRLFQVAHEIYSVRVYGEA